MVPTTCDERPLDAVANSAESRDVVVETQREKLRENLAEVYKVDLYPRVIRVVVRGSEDRSQAHPAKQSWTCTKESDSYRDRSGALPRTRNSVSI